MLPSATRTYIVYPNKFRVDAEIEIPGDDGRPMRTQTTQVFNAGRFKVDMAKYPTLKRIFDRCMTLPAFDVAQPAKQPDAET